MIINKTYTAVCRGCKKTFNLYNYVGLSSDSLMGDHYCAEIQAYLKAHPRAWKSFDKLKEVKS